MRLRAISTRTLIHRPSRVDTSDHLSASAGTIWVYDSTSLGALLAADSVWRDRGSGAKTFFGSARGRAWLRRFGEFSSRRPGAGGDRLSAHHRQGLRRTQQSAKTVAVRSVRRGAGLA